MASRTKSPPRRAVAASAMRALTPGETAWSLVLPATLVAVGLIALAGRPLGQLLFTGARYTYWPSAVTAELFPKPAELARFVLAVAAALAFAAVVLLAARRPVRAAARRIDVGVAAAQALCVALLVLLWSEQRHVHFPTKPHRIYFTIPTIAVAMLLAFGAAVALTRPQATARLAALSSRRWRAGCAVAAVAVTTLWLLPSIYSDGNVALAPLIVTHHLEFAFDESMSVLDGRSPLVNMTAYGTLIPYLVGAPLSVLGASLAAYIGLMLVLTGGALLAVYAVLRRLTRHALAALALYVPFLATSLFLTEGTTVVRYDYGNYFMMFPVRYAGPYLLAWLTTRQLDGDRPRRPEPLFAVAGLVALNNTDFGLPALGATIVALLCARPPASVGAALRLLRSVAAGLAIALGLVTVLTLLRAGSLPHLGLLFAYAKLFGVSGFGNLPMPLLGFHLVIFATFLASLVTAIVRMVGGSDHATLTGMLAWCGIFGLGTGAYYAYRSHPDTLIALFSIWSLTLALLLVVVVRAALARTPRRVTIPDVAVLLGFGLAVCSIAQLPLPWRQVERIDQRAADEPMRMLPARDFIQSRTHPGERVAILISLGHRLAYESGVTDVAAYTGMWQMPTAEQLDETIRTLRREGGSKLFLGQFWWPEVETALRRAGFARRPPDPASGFLEWDLVKKSGDGGI